MSKILRLKKNLEHKNFNQLLDYCFDLSKYFSFTKRKFHLVDNVYTEFLQELSPFYVKTIFTSHWFCYYVSQTDPLEICLFVAENYTKYIIKKYFDNLFQCERGLDGTLGNIKNLPEDLCFFSNNKLLLGTVSHESICYAYPYSEEINSEFKKLGSWEEMDYSSEEHIIIEI